MIYKYWNKVMLLTLFILTSCIGANNLQIAIKNPKQLNSAVISVANVQLISNQVVITGTNLNEVSGFKIVNGGATTNLVIESKSATSIVANTLSNVTFAAGVVFDFVLSTATASSTFQVTFSMSNNSITAAMLTSMGATTGQIMKYNGAAWVPSTITNAQTYLGTWSAAGNSPNITSPSSTPGDYYIVSSAGTLSGITYAIGDWIISDGYNWQKVANSAVVVSTFNGRRGTVTLVPGDYATLKSGGKITGSSINDLADINIASEPGNGEVLIYNNTTHLWVPGTISAGAGTVTGVTSATTDISVAGSTSPILTLNSGTGADQIVKLTAAAKLPAVDGSLLTSLNPASLASTVAVGKGGTGLSAGTTGGLPYFASTSTMASSAAGTAGDLLISGGATAPAWISTLPIANGGTGAATAPLARSALGIASAATYANGSTTGTVPLLGTLGIVGSNICTGDNAGGIICSPMTSSVVAGSVSDETGSGVMVFGTSPTITDPVIANLAPVANFSLTQNSTQPFTSESVGAIINTLYLKAGRVGIGTNNPGANLEINGSSGSTLKIVDGNQGLAKVLTSDANGVASWAAAAGGSSQWTTASSDIYYTTGKVGVGVLAPVAKLDIATTAAGGKVVSAVSSDATAAVNYGVYASTASFGLGSVGVYGLAAGAGYVSGVTGYASASGGYGVGVTGMSESSNGYGVSGISNYQWSGSNSAGGYFQANGVDSYALKAVSNGTSGNSIAVYASSPNSATGFGIYSAAGKNYFNGKVGIGVLVPTYQLELSTDSAGKPGTSTWTIASDARLKDVRAPFNRGLDAIMEINPIYFKYKKDNPLHLPSDKEYVGIIAQDAQKAVPESVNIDKLGYLHLTNDAIIWTLLNAVKELYQQFLNEFSTEKSSGKLAKLEAEIKIQDEEIKDLKVQNKTMKNYLCYKDPTADICKNL
ncbi:MAG: tail fiber domain-containing protein [Bacteriovorax sp.]|nr:tail fiber domain-containing protein [Bacteriovorax sp.]